MKGLLFSAVFGLTGSYEKINVPDKWNCVIFTDNCSIVKAHDSWTIIEVKKPKAFILENVKGLRSHDQGRTLNIILEVLRDDLSYFVPDPKILNSKDFGLPQNRERIFIVGFLKKNFLPFYQFCLLDQKLIYLHLLEFLPEKLSYHSSL